MVKRRTKIVAIIAILIVAVVVSVYILIPKKARADVIIWVQFLQEEEDLTSDYIENSFRQLYPDITVELMNVADLRTRLLAALPAGKGPDLFMWAHDWTGEFAEAGYIVPLDEFVTPELMANFLDIAVNACTYNGSIYALPFAAETVALIYNKDMLAELGVEPPENMSQLISIMEKAEKEMGTYGIAYQLDGYYISAWPHAFGGYYFRDEDKSVGVNSTGTIQGIRYYLEKFTPYMYKGDTSKSAQVAIFEEEKAPFIIDGPWGIGTLKESNISFGVTVLPKINQTHWPKPYTGIRVIWMSSDVYNKEKAFTFMKWFTTNSTHIKHRALELGFIPVLEEVLELEEIKNDEVVSAYAQQVELGIPMPKSREMMMVWGPVWDAVAEAFIGVGGTLEELLNDAQREILEDIAEA